MTHAKESGEPALLLGEEFASGYVPFLGRAEGSFRVYDGGRGYRRQGQEHQQCHWWTRTFLGKC